MKRFVKSAGIAALALFGLGVASVHAQYFLAPGLSQQELSKTWSVSAALRGFYDDNYNTGNGSAARESFGAEFAPAVSANFPLERTYIGLSLRYSGRYYEDRPDNEFDHTFQFDANLAHAFSERYKLDLTESFVSSQEPDLLDPANQSQFIRTDANNMRNRAGISLTTGLTPTLSAVWGYVNTFYDFDQEGTGSRSALLDRLEHLFSINGRYQASPTTVYVVGFQYGISDFTSDDLLTDSTDVRSENRLAESRNNRALYGFIGVDHSFTAQLQGSLRGGIQNTEFDKTVPSTSDTSPYVDASLSYTYAPGSFLQAGARHQRNATDVSGFDLGGTLTTNSLPTVDAESTVIYAALNHQFTANLTASILGQVQFSDFNGGQANSLSETFFTLGFHVAYRINQFLSAEAGYNFDNLDTDISGRGFDRNRIYIGLRAVY